MAAAPGAPALHEFHGTHSDYFLASAEDPPSQSRPDGAVVPLVVIIGWLDTQRQWRRRKAIDKAALTAGMYTRRGCDVLFLQLRVPQHVVPALVRPTVRELLDIVCFLLQPSGPSTGVDGGDVRPRPLLFHVFSGGCYMFGEMLGMLTGGEDDLDAPDAAEDGDAVGQRHVLAVAGSLAGLFADSPVMAEDTPRGLAALLAGNLSYRKATGPAYWLLRASMGVTMTLSHPIVGHHLAAASRLVELLPVRKANGSALLPSPCLSIFMMLLPSLSWQTIGFNVKIENKDCRFLRGPSWSWQLARPESRACHAVRKLTPWRRR